LDIQKSKLFLARGVQIWQLFITTFWTNLYETSAIIADFSPALSASAEVPLVGDQSAMPGQNGVESNDASELAEKLPA